MSKPVYAQSLLMFRLALMSKQRVERELWAKFNIFFSTAHNNPAPGSKDLSRSIIHFVSGGIWSPSYTTLTRRVGKGFYFKLFFS